MTAEYPMSSRTELLSVVARRLHEEFPAVAGDQVVRCVQIAREFAKSSSEFSAGPGGDPEAYAVFVETQARNYLAKFEAIRTRAPVPPSSTVIELGTTTVVELGAAERRRPGRHRRGSKTSNAVA